MKTNDFPDMNRPDTNPSTQNLKPRSSHTCIEMQNLYWRMRVSE